MEFLGAVIETVFKMVVVGAVAFGGVRLGMFLRKRKDAKKDEAQDISKN
ncbi:MAG: hypothetical protein UHS49_07450 [Faecalimonas sp.]|nr:hypothetical protein [Faecalimonas sp.]